jgi:hypothetical protein
MAAENKSPRPGREIGDYLTYLLVLLLGLLGPVMARSAHDIEIFVFGVSLFLFAALFLYTEYRRSVTVAEAARIDARKVSGHE